MTQVLDALTIELKAELSGLTSALKTAAKNVEAYSAAAEKKGNVKLSANMAALQGQLAAADAAVDNFSRNVTKASLQASRDLDTNLGTSVAALRTSILALGGAWAAWTVGKEVIEAGMQMQALENRMAAATGNTEVAANAMAYVREESERLGLRMQTTAGGFADLAAASLRAGLTLQQTKDIFTGVSEAATALQLTPERVGFVFMALSQMASKGKVSMEELSQQLGESLPGALALFANAMGKTQPEFIKMVENGQVTVADLSKLGDRLHTEFADKAEDAAQGAQGAFNRLENALFELKARVAEAGILDAVVDGVKDLTDVINDPQVQQGLIDLAALIAGVGSAALKAAAHLGTFAARANGAIEGVGNSLPFGLGDEVQKQRAAKKDSQTFQQRMLQQFIKTSSNSVVADNTAGGLLRPASSGEKTGGLADDSWYNPASSKGDLGSYTLKPGGPDIPVDEKALRDAERERKKREREAEAARNKQQREAEAQAREREQLSGQVRNMDVAMGTDPEKYRAELEDQQKILQEALDKKAITQQRYNDMMAETEAAYREKLNEYVLEQFGTETELEDERYADKQKKLEEALELKLVTEEEYRRMTEELEQEHQDTLNDIREAAARKAMEQQEASNKFRHDAENRTLGSILDLVQVFANKNKTIALAMLAFEKAKAIAESIIYTHAAAAKALIQDPSGATSAYVTALGYANVAAIAATGIAQAAMLASSDSKGGGGSSGGGTSFNSSTGQYESNTTGGRGGVKYVNISLEGRDTSTFTKQQVRELMEQFNEASRDGSRLIVSTS